MNFTMQHAVSACVQHSTAFCMRLCARISGALALEQSLYAGVKAVTQTLQQVCEQARTAELKLAQAETVSTYTWLQQMCAITGVDSFRKQRHTASECSCVQCSLLSCILFHNIM
jgi:hypothetical protein